MGRSSLISRAINPSTFLVAVIRPRCLAKSTRRVCLMRQVLFFFPCRQAIFPRRKRKPCMVSGKGLVAGKSGKNGPERGNGFKTIALLAERGHGIQVERGEHPG